MGLGLVKRGIIFSHMAAIESIEHYLPQFVLRGFTVRSGVGQVYYFQAGVKRTACCPSP